MATYFREHERFDTGLPTISSRAGLVDNRHDVHALTDPSPRLDRHVRFSRAVDAAIYDPPAFTPRPPSPSGRKHVMDVRIDCKIDVFNSVMYLKWPFKNHLNKLDL